MVLTRAPFDRFEVSSRPCALLRSGLFHFRPCQAARIAAPDAVPYRLDSTGIVLRRLQHQILSLIPINNAAHLEPVRQPQKLVVLFLGSHL